MKNNNMKNFLKYLIMCLICVVVFASYLIYVDLITRNNTKCKVIDQEYSKNLIEEKKDFQVENKVENGLENVKLSLQKNPNEILYSYISLPLSHSYGANLIPLLMSALITTGDLLELGVGMFSTPLLHKVAFDFNRKLVSVDTDYEWLQRFILYNKTQSHKIYWLQNEDAALPVPAEKKWGIVLVDQLYRLRARNVIKYANFSEIVVVHDTEKIREQIYWYEKANIGSYYKYACKFSLYGHLGEKGNYSSTTIYSNYIDVEAELKPIFDRVNTPFGHKTCDMTM